jgi:hypothetical protein
MYKFSSHLTFKKPWTVRCLRKSNRFIVGSSTGTLDIYTIPSMITDSNIKSLTTYTTSHDAGLSYANQFPNPYGNILTSSNWFDGRLVVSWGAFERILMKYSLPTWTLEKNCTLLKVTHKQ